MTTLLVTGGCGFIGAAYIRSVIRSSNWHVANIDRLTYAANPESLEEARTSDKYTFVQADIGDRAALKEAFARFRPDAVVNLAAETHVDRSIDGPILFVDTNVGGTAQLLAEALAYWRNLPAAVRGNFRFHHVSTDEVYGALDTDDPPFDESSPYRPTSPYAASKAAADHLVRSWSSTYGLPTLITNCTNNYGPWQFPEKLIPLMIVKAALGEEMPVYGRGENLRDWLHVDDHVDGLRLALEHGKPGETYCFGGGTSLTNIDVVHAICDLVDARLGHLASGSRRQLVRLVTDRPGHDFRYALSSAKAAKILGWRPRHGFSDGLAQTVDWYLAHRQWWEAVRADNNGLQRLGLGA